MRTFICLIAIAGAALLAGCDKKPAAPQGNTTEVAPVENAAVSDAMVTGIESAPATENGAEPAGNVTEAPE